jgi:hypothetical protein
VTKPSSIPERVTKPEQRLPEVARKADKASYLARKSSEDVATFGQKLNAHTKLLEALRVTQVEHGKRFDSLESEMRKGFATIHVGMRHITALLTVAEVSSDET